IGVRFVKTLTFCFLAVFGGVIGGAGYVATQLQYQSLGLHGNQAWKTPPFPVALAADPYVGAGSLILPAASYASCTDAGGGLCVVNGGWQIANPVLEGIVFNGTAPQISSTLTTAFNIQSAST